MSVNANTARCRPSLGVGVLVAEGGIGPRPAGTYHQRLKVVLASKTDRDGTVVLAVIIDLVTRHWAAGDESDKSLRRKRAGEPLTIIASLALLRCVDAEQPHKLRAKLYGITVYDLEARLCGRSDDGVIVGFRVSRRGQHEGKKWSDQCSSYQLLPISPVAVQKLSRVPTAPNHYRLPWPCWRFPPLW
jgi:hypothetical protein